MSKGYASLCEYINGKSVSLIGAGVSNVPLVSFLYECGAKSVTVRDLKKKKEDPEISIVLQSGGEVVLGEKLRISLSPTLSNGVTHKHNIRAHTRSLQFGIELLVTIKFRPIFLCCRLLLRAYTHTRAQCKKHR
jgi:UDP-N-acetylmuramoylalanine-D-glutamate ligase